MESDINIEYFFATIKPLFGKFTQSQIDGIHCIIDKFEEQSVVLCRNQLAYILATIHHETNKTFQPIEEYGKGKGKLYGGKFKINGKPYFKPDKIYYGRGFVQVTWYDNYKKLTEEAYLQGMVNWDFLNNPELLLEKEKSKWACFVGMERGYFTGKRLDDYIKRDSWDFVNARKIINGLDKAELIASYAKVYWEALR